LAYFFDSGIITRGLLALARETGEAEFRQRAYECGRNMARDFVRDGTIYPILELPSKVPLPFGAGWSRNPGCYQLKSALGWLELGQREAYESALGQALANEDQFLPGETDPLKVMDRLHAYCYFLEALLPVMDRPACRQVLATGLAKVAGYLREISPQFARSDV